jgi:hypothetical protein
VAEGVVHELEPVDVEEHHRDVPTVGGCVEQGLLESLEELPSVRQAGERVVVRLELQLVLRLGGVGHHGPELLLAAAEIGLDRLLLPGRVREHPDHEAHTRGFEHCEAVPFGLRKHASRDAQHDCQLAQRDPDDAEDHCRTTHA